MSENPVSPIYSRDFLEGVGKLSLGAVVASGFGIGTARAQRQTQKEWKRS